VKLFIFLLSFFSATAFATTNPEGCGLYDIHGIIEYSKADSRYIYFVNKGSLSEYQFIIDLKDEIKIAPFIERSIKMRAFVSEEPVGHKGKFQNILSLEYGPADPLLLKNNSNFFLVKKEKCRK
jgi:hypothetical protein